MTVMPSPQVSVIVVSKNRRQYLVELLASLSQQTFRRFELIIVENASQAITRDYVESLSWSDSDINLKRVYLEQEQTVSYCRNYPFRHQLVHPQSKYVYFIDDDDVIFNYTLKLLVRRIEQTQAQVVFGNTVRAYCQGELLKNPYQYINYKQELSILLRSIWRIHLGKLLFPQQRWLFARHFMAALPIHSYLVDIELIRKHEFQDEITYGEDSLLLYKMSADVKKVRSIPYLFVIYRRHGDNCGDPHNYVKKVKADPLTFEFCKSRYTSQELFMLFFQEYLDDVIQHYKTSLGHAKHSLPYSGKFDECVRNTPSITKLMTALLYPVLTARFSLLALTYTCLNSPRNLFNRMKIS